MPLAEDEPTLPPARAGVLLAHRTRAAARPQPLREARGGALARVAGRLGATQALGALAMEIGVWGPQRAGAGARGPVDAYFKNGGAASRMQARDVSPVEQAWARWLDDTRGGSGFIDWQPIELPGTTGALDRRLGDRHGLQSAASTSLPQALHGLDAFVLDLARSLPRLEVDARARTSATARSASSGRA